MEKRNLILSTDSYKISHWLQYPPNTKTIYSYFECRGGLFPETVFFSLQYLVKSYLTTPITKEDIDEAEEFFKLHFGNTSLFNRAGWEYILEKYNGYLPLRIKAVPEGMVVPTRNVMMTVENTDENCYWLTNYMETLLCHIWYGTTVATLSREMKKLILRFLKKTGDVSLIDFKLHDFGYRGVSSAQSAGIGGVAHLVNFKGTDTIESLVCARKYYHCIMAGYSIPAAEHSTITSWGRDYEVDAYRNMIKQYGNGSIYAVVSDSYDIYKACEQLWGKELKAEVLAAKGTLVVRPDSGTPHEVVVKVLDILGKQFGFTLNDKGYKVLNPKVRVIQGDGIDYEETRNILTNMEKYGWSTDNISFGMGGGLLQKLDRDTQSCAFKCCYARVGDSDRDVYKTPITDSGKMSKRGKLALVQKNGKLETVKGPREDDLLETIYENGILLKEYSLDEIRDRAKINLDLL